MKHTSINRYYQCRGWPTTKADDVYRRQATMADDARHFSVLILVSDLVLRFSPSLHSHDFPCSVRFPFRYLLNPPIHHDEHLSWHHFNTRGTGQKDIICGLPCGSTFSRRYICVMLWDTPVEDGLVWFTDQGMVVAPVFWPFRPVATRQRRGEQKSTHTHTNKKKRKKEEKNRFRVWIFGILWNPSLCCYFKRKKKWKVGRLN